MIGLLSQILPEFYTSDRLNSLFLSSSAPDQIPEGSKSKKVTSWLKNINEECEDPLIILGQLLEDFLDQDIDEANWFSPQNEEELKIKRDNYKNKILDSLHNSGLIYSFGGKLSDSISPATVSLQKIVTKLNLSSVDIEIKRALLNVGNDPLAATHYAGSVMESVLKSYLNHHRIAYKEDKFTLSDLWRSVIEHIGINPKEMDDKDLKKIASGLFNIVDGTMHLRNKKSAAHGKSEAQMKANTIRPRHARLAIHAAHTVSAYVLELIDKD